MRLKSNRQNSTDIKMQDTGTPFLPIALCLALICGNAFGAPKAGEQIPSFELPDLDGATVSAERLSEKDLSILYFFSVSCDSCAQGLTQLNGILSGNQDKKLSVLGIGKQSAAELRPFLADLGLSFPILSADQETLGRFNAAHVFPTTYILGPGRVIHKVLQGGGASAQILLAEIAEKQLRRNRPEVARKIYTVLQQGELGAKAKAGVGYSLLREGKLAEASRTFAELAESDDAQLAITGNEGLAETYLQQGQVEQAGAKADAVLSVAPERGPARLIKAKVLYREGQTESAAREVKLAAAPGAQSDFTWQIAEAHFAKANIQRQIGQLDSAVAAYDQALTADPYYVAAMSNKGVTLQDMGDPEGALEVLSQLQRLDPTDPLVTSLLRQSHEAIAQNQDLERNRYINTLVDDLILQSQSMQGQQPATDDAWTSPALAVTIMDFKKEGDKGLMARAGVEDVLKEELTQQLRARHINVVDRALLDSLLAELKLGSSALSDPDTQLRIGHILAARLISTGAIYSGAAGNFVTFRLVDTETTGIALSLSEQEAAQIDPTTVAKRLATAIAALIEDKYPRKGRIALVDGDSVIINLGEKHGIVPGMVFDVLGESKPVELNGRVLGQQEEKLGQLEVQRVEELLAYSDILEKNGELEKNQRIVQNIADPTAPADE